MVQRNDSNSRVGISGWRAVWSGAGLSRAVCRPSGPNKIEIYRNPRGQQNSPLDSVFYWDFFLHSAAMHSGVGFGSPRLDSTRLGVMI